RDEGDIQALRLEVTRTDAIASDILVDYAHDFDAGTLDLTLTAEEAAGGLVAELAGLPPTSASRVSLTAAGPLTDWAVDLALSSDDVIEVAGDARIGLGDPLNITAALAVDPGEALDPGVARLIAPRATLDLAVVQGDDGVIRVERGAIASPVLRATAAGFVDPDGPIDLDVDLAADPGVLEEGDGLAFETVAFTGRVDGTAEDLDASGRLQIAGLASPSLDVGDGDVEATLAIDGPVTAFRMEGDIEGLRLDRLGPDLLGAAQIRGAGTFEEGVLRLDLARLTTQPLIVQAGGVADTNEGVLDFRYEATARDLAPLAAAYDTAAEGAFAMQGTLDGPDAEPRLDGSIALSDLALEGESYGAVRLTHDATFGAVPAGRIALTADGSRYGPAEVSTDFTLNGNTLGLTALRVAALDATVAGAIDLDLSTTLATGQVTLDVPSLEKAEAATGIDLAGRAAGTVDLSTETVEQAFGTTQTQQVADLDLDLTDLAGFEAEVEAIALTGRLTDLTGNLGGDVELDVTAARHPQGSLERGRIVAGLTSLLRRGSVDLDVVLDGIEAPELATIDSLEGEIDLASLDRAPSATVDIVARRLASPAVEGGATVRELRLDGTFTELDTAPGGEARLAIEEIAAAGYTVARVSGETRLADLTGAAAAEGQVTAETVAGPDASLDDATVTFALEDLTGEGRGTVEALVRGIGAAGYTVREVTAETTLAALTTSPGAEGRVTAEGVDGPDATVDRAAVEFDMEDLGGEGRGTVGAVIDGIGAAGYRVTRVTADTRLAALLASPAAEGRVTAEGVSGPDATVAAATVDFDLEDLTGTGSGTVDAVIERLGGAASARRITLDADMTGLTDPAGTVAVRTEGLAAGGAEIGTARLDARLTDRGERTDAEARLDVPSVAAEGATVEAIALTARAADALGRPNLDVALTVGRVEAADVVLEGPRFTAQGPLSRLALAFDAAGEVMRKPLTARLRATADVDGPLNATVSELAATLGEGEVALDQPLRLRQSGDTTRVQDLGLSLPGGRVGGDVALHGAGFSGEVTVDFTDLGQLKTLVEDLPIDRGTVDLDAAFDTRPGRTRATVAGRLAELEFGAAVADVGALGLDLDADWNGRRMDADAAISGPFGDPVRITAAIPLAARGGTPALVENGPLEATVDWQGRLGDLWVLVPAPAKPKDSEHDNALSKEGTQAHTQICGPRCETDVQ
ncbi:MAG: hypothetical protein AAFR52_10670, partial [Pseudomonadota bacterium]